MPKTKLQEVVFTILMVFVMVYAMICYNIALNMGGMSNIVFLNAFHETIEEKLGKLNIIAEDLGFLTSQPQCPCCIHRVWEMCFQQANRHF